MAKRKKKAAVKKKRPIAKPKKVKIVQSKTTTIGKAKRTPAKNASYYMKQAKEKLYSEMGNLMIKKEKATKKSNKKKIGKQISEKRRQINKLK